MGGLISAPSVQSFTSCIGPILLVGSNEINPASILLTRDGDVLLVDLELAETSTDSIYNVRQGSWDFMPFEVASKRYRFIPQKVDKRPSFRYNILHELESVWWLVTWMLFFHYPHPIHYPDPHGTGYRQTRVVVQLFPNYYDYPHQSILGGRI